MLLAILFFVVTIFGGMFLGIFLAKRKFKKESERLIKNALEVIQGERENSIEIEGKKLVVDTFVVRDDDDKDIKIKLNGELAK